MSFNVEGEIVTTLYAFIAPTEISSKHDPMRVLKFNSDKQALLADLTYDPETVSFFALKIFKAQGQQVAVTNTRIGDQEIVSVCTLET